jgi:CubicO group peptidase (beta-lactamase class C family)
MSQRITRRQLLGSGIKAGFGLALWKELNLGTVPAFAFTPAKAAFADDARFQPAFARLDEFIAAHLRDIGAPGMTLALVRGLRVFDRSAARWANRHFGFIGRSNRYSVDTSLGAVQNRFSSPDCDRSSYG